MKVQRETGSDEDNRRKRTQKRREKDRESHRQMERQTKTDRYTEREMHGRMDSDIFMRITDYSDESQWSSLQLGGDARQCLRRCDWKRFVHFSGIK